MAQEFKMAAVKSVHWRHARFKRKVFYKRGLTKSEEVFLPLNCAQICSLFLHHIHPSRHLCGCSVIIKDETEKHSNIGQKASKPSPLKNFLRIIFHANSSSLHWKTKSLGAHKTLACAPSDRKQSIFCSSRTILTIWCKYLGYIVLNVPCRLG
jgi:hypothetical protein